MKILFLSIFLLFPAAVFAQRDLCDLIKIPNCESITKQGRRSSFQSLPSPAAAANLNPANVSFDRGLGVEFVFQAGNPTNYNLASGTGKLGGALISQSLENSFFGNRNVETDADFLYRNQEQKQYKSKKLNLALGGRVFGRKNYSLDLGILLKRHNDIKRINAGVGMSARLGFVTFGASSYQDDFFINQSSTVLTPYQEKFNVQTLSGGVRYRNFSLDAGVIKTKYAVYNEESTIKLIAASYAYKRFLFNVAQRVENSQAVKYENDVLLYEKVSNSYYWGVQTSIGKHLIVGVAYNYFLLREMTLNTTIFF